MLVGLTTALLSVARREDALPLGYRCLEKYFIVLGPGHALAEIP